MKQKKKYSTAEIISVVFCIAGCSLIAAPLFTDSGSDYLSAGMACNGIGIAAMLYGRKTQ